MNQYRRVSLILEKLELELRQLALWQPEAPSAEALAST